MVSPRAALRRGRGQVATQRNGYRGGKKETYAKSVWEMASKGLIKANTLAFTCRMRHLHYSHQRTPTGAAHVQPTSTARSADPCAAACRMTRARRSTVL